MTGLDGRRLLIVSRRDIGHPQAGDEETYLHQIALRWVGWGTQVTWAATRAPGATAHAVIDGIEILRAGHPRIASRRFDAVVDGTGRLTGRRTPVVRVAHRASQAVSGPMARWRGDTGAIAVPSPSARHELRRRHGCRGPIFVVPPGITPGPATKERSDPTVVVATPLNQDLRAKLLGALAQVPHLRVDIVGDGPELDVALGRAWLTVSTATYVCGCGVLAAAARGVPCVGLAAPGSRDFVRDGWTGQIVDTEDQLGPAVVRQLAALADVEHARRTADLCRAWADRFSWERSAQLLAGIVIQQIGAHVARRDRRYARPDIATVVRFPAGAGLPPGTRLRATDEVSVADGVTSVLLNGCDEFDAIGVLDRIGVRNADIRLADWDDLLVGPHGLPPALTEEPDVPVGR